MSFDSESIREDYTGNGAADTYSFDFKIAHKSHLLVTIRNTDDQETTLDVDTHYTVTGVGEAAGGSIALVNGAFDWLDADGDLESGYHITIRSKVPLTQETDIRNQGDYYPETIEDRFDYQTKIDLQQQDEIDRSVRMPETISAAVFNPQLPAEFVGSVNRTLMTNADGDAFEPGPTADEISSAQTHASNAADSATAAAASETAAASSASASATSATASAASAAAAQAAANSIMFRDVEFLDVSDSPYTVLAADRGKMFAVDASGGAVTINLPTIAGLDLSSPWIVAVKKTDGSGNSITINRGGTDTIDSGASKTVGSADAGAIFMPDTDTAPDEWTTAEFGATPGNLTISRFSGDGSTVAFALSIDPGSENNTQVYVDGVYQQKNTYSVSGTTLTFSTAPPTGTDNIEVSIGTTIAIGTPSDGSVSVAKLGDGALAASAQGRAKMADGFLSADATGRAKMADGFADYTKVAAGAVVQEVHYQTGAYASGTTTTPLDDTIPQNTEGHEFMTLAITPKSATNRLIIDVDVQLSCGTADRACTVALHQDSTANALAAIAKYLGTSAEYQRHIRFSHEMAAGTTSATTFKVRVGANAAGTIYLNGNASNRLLGGVSVSSIHIREVKA